MKTRLKNKKGFTLIELIVVMVILAILAAAAVPAMIGFIGDARGKALIAEARVGYIAAQSVYTEYTSAGNDIGANGAAQFNSGTGYAAANTKFGEMITPDDLQVADFKITTDGKKVSKVVYTKGSYAVTIEPGKNATVVKTGS